MTATAESGLKMSNEKWYTVKVTEKHSDVVTVKASSKDEALRRATEESECTFECSYDAEVLSVSDDE